MLLLRDKFYFFATSYKVAAIPSCKIAMLLRSRDIAFINICRVTAWRSVTHLKFVTQMHSGGVEYLASEGIVWSRLEDIHSINIRQSDTIVAPGR